MLLVCAIGCQSPDPTDTQSVAADTDTTPSDTSQDSAPPTDTDTDTAQPCIDYADIVADCHTLVVPGDGGGTTWDGLDPTSATLADDLHERLQDHDAISYDALWDAFPLTDARSDGTVWDMYSDPGDGEPAYVYTFGVDQCGEYGGEGDCYNREHSFPQSWSDDAAPMRSDLHQVFPVDGWVNNVRSSLPFGLARGSAATSNGSLRGDSLVCDYDGEVFEPADAFKGDLARAQLYMSVRYRGDDASWSSSDATVGASLEPWFEEVLLAWHLLDPVSDKERERNDAVEGVQGNRNPFVDRPELACGIADF